MTSPRDSKDTLVLVPGLNCDAELFGPQIAAFAPSHRIVVADVASDDGIPGMARRLLAQAPERFALAGLSMGGYVALEVFRQAPQRVTHLGLLNTTARADPPEDHARREQFIALARSGRFEEVHRTLWQRLVHPSFFADQELEAVVLRMMRATGPETFVRQQRALMARSDSRSLLPGIEIPTLVLVGDSDAITPPLIAHEMAEAVEWASLVVVPECGHFSTLERPEAVTAALKAWLARSWAEL